MNKVLSLLRAPATEPVVLALLTIAVAAVRVRLAVTDGGATLFFDEAYYVENARAIFALGAYSTAHYPPLYSLLLAPGLLAESWYPATMAISAATSALAVPAAWFLARSADFKLPLLAALAVGLLTSAFAYSTFMMSENLSTPIFVLAVALTIRARAQEGWMLGVAATALVLTKYLFLPVAVILIVAYLVLRQRHEPNRPRNVRLKEVALAFAAPILGGAAWLTYALGSGFSLFQAIGLTDPTSTFERSVSEGEVQDLLLWIVVYVGALMLPALPTALLAVLYLTRRRSIPLRLHNRQAALAVLTAILATVAVAVAVQHSFGAPYNYPEPTLAWPRYLMHLGPVLLVVGLVLLQTLTSTDRSPVRVALLVALGALVAGGGLAVWWFLFREGSGIVAWGFTAPITAADLFPLRTIGTLVLTVGATMLVAALTVMPIARSWASTIGSGVIILLLGLTTANYINVSIPVDPFVADYADTNGSLTRKMLDVLESDAVKDKTTVFFLTDGVVNGNLYWQLRFWDRSPDEIQAPLIEEFGLSFPERDPASTKALFEKLAALDECAAPRDVCYLVTRVPLPVEGRLDDRWGQTLYFHRVP